MSDTSELYDVAEIYDVDEGEEKLSNKVKGVVSFINSKDWEDRRKGVTIQLYSFKVEGDETWYRTGTNKPKFEKGQSIQFEVGDKGNVDLDTVEVLEVAIKVAPKAAARPSSGSGEVTRDGYWSNKEARDLVRDERYQTVDIPRMTYCTAQDAAVALVTAALQHECLPKLTDTKIAKSSRLQALLTYVDEVADRFYRQRMSAGGAVEVVGEEQPEETAKEKTLDE